MQELSSIEGWSVECAVRCAAQERGCSGNIDLSLPGQRNNLSYRSRTIKHTDRHQRTSPHHLLHCPRYIQASMADAERRRSKAVSQLPAMTEPQLEPKAMENSKHEQRHIDLIQWLPTPCDSAGQGAFEAMLRTRKVPLQLSLGCRQHGKLGSACGPLRQGTGRGC